MSVLAVHKARRLKWTPPTWDDFATAANAFEPQLRAAFLETLAAATKRVDIEELGYALEQRDFDRAASLLLGGRAAAGTVGWEALDAAVRVAIWRAAVRTGQPLAVAGLIRSANPNSLTAIRFQALNLIREIDQNTREGIRAYVTAQLAEGKNPRALIPEIAGRVRANGERTGGIVGLTERQALAVRNYRANLEGLDRDALQRALRDKRFDGTVERAMATQQALEPAYIDKLVTRYEANMRAYRAETIARTESMRALAEGQRLAWDTAFGEDRADRSEYVKTWYTASDERVRPEHAEMEGVTVDYDEDFEPEDTGPIWGPPVAVNCRCVAWIHPREVEEFGPPPEEQDTEKSAVRERTLFAVLKGGDWDESKHPRDEHGRWTVGAVITGEAGSAAAGLVARVRAALTDDLRAAKYRGASCAMTGHCYVAAEALYHALGGKAAGWTPMFLRHEDEPHWFLRHRDGSIVDATADQFKTPVPYAAARGKGFLTGEPSRRAATVLGRVEKEWDESKHPRVPPGSPEGGEWVSAAGSPSDYTHPPLDMPSAATTDAPPSGPPAVRHWAADDRENTLRNYEEVIRREPLEHGRLIGPEGNVLLDATDGLDYLIDWSAPDRQRAVNAASVLTHNHPDATPLSGGDIRFAILHQLEEIRAVGEWADGRHVVTSMTGFPADIGKRFEVEEYFDKTLNRMNGEFEAMMPSMLQPEPRRDYAASLPFDSALDAEIRKAQANGAGKPPEAAQLLLHEARAMVLWREQIHRACKNTAKKYGMTYTRTLYR